MEQVAFKLDLKGWVGFQQADVRVGRGERSCLSTEKWNMCSGDVECSGVTGSQNTSSETEETRRT